MTPNIVTPERAKEIEEQLGALGPLPWLYNGFNGDRYTVVAGPHRFTVCFMCGPGPVAKQGYSFESRGQFIANAPDDLRDLLHTLAVEREENARLRAENEKLTELTKGFVTAIKWWAAQEDGIPEEVAPAFVGGMFVLGWEFSTNHDLQALAALAPRGEGKDGL